MKLPTSNGNDLYQIGNDYPQVAEQYFNTSAYADGIYTELKYSGFSAEKPQVDGFDASFFAGKDPMGLNKRILNVLPQTKWDDVTSADVRGDFSAVSGEIIFSNDYATAELSSFPPVEE